MEQRGEGLEAGGPLQRGEGLEAGGPLSREGRV